MSRPGALAFYNIYRMSRHKAKKDGIENPITPKIVTQILEQPCVFCGGETQCATYADRSLPLSPENLRPSCLRCRDIQRDRTIDVMLSWVSDVSKAHAAAAPVSPAVLSGGPKLAYAKQLAREFGGKTKDGKVYKNAFLVPPHVHQTAKIGETFEEKLARYAKASAERAEAGKGKGEENAAESWN